jgi:hypothetical protein
MHSDIQERHKVVECGVRGLQGGAVRAGVYGGRGWTVELRKSGSHQDLEWGSLRDNAVCIHPLEEGHRTDGEWGIWA